MLPAYHLLLLDWHLQILRKLISFVHSEAFTLISLFLFQYFEPLGFFCVLSPKFLCDYNKCKTSRNISLKDRFLLLPTSFFVSSNGYNCHSGLSICLFWFFLIKKIQNWQSTFSYHSHACIYFILNLKIMLTFMYVKIAHYSIHQEVWLFANCYTSLFLLEGYKEQTQKYAVPLILFTIHLADPPMLLEIDWVHGKHFNVRTRK